MQLEDYEEMDDFDFSRDDGTVICDLLVQANRYENLAKDMKAKATEMMADKDVVHSSECINLSVHKMSRKTNKVNNEMLYLSYRDVYNELASKGKLVAKHEDLKDYDVSGVVTTTTSTYLKLKD